MAQREPLNRLTRVLVTGGAGSVGLEVLGELYRRKGAVEVLVLDRNTPEVLKSLSPYKKDFQIITGNLYDRAILERCSKRIDMVIHLAAIIPPLADKNPDLAERVNIEGTKLLIRALERNSPGAFFLYTSSVSIYGDRVSSPIISVDDPLLPSEGDEYAKTKIVAESLVRKSGLSWSIFRLSAIMGPKTRMDPLFFHMPLDTSLEIATARDTGFAVVAAMDHLDEIAGRTFNLSGGLSCRTSYREFLGRAFQIAGLKKLDFPEEAFAQRNFHCGFLSDSHILNDILHYQRDSLEDYFQILEAKYHGISRTFTSFFHKIIKKGLIRKSEPLAALRKGLREEIRRFYFPVAGQG